MAIYGTKKKHHMNHMALFGTICNQLRAIIWHHVRHGVMWHHGATGSPVLGRGLPTQGYRVYVDGELAYDGATDPVTRE